MSSSARARSTSKRSTTAPHDRVAPSRAPVELLPDEGGDAVEVEDRVEVGPAPGERHEHVLVADAAAHHPRGAGPGRLEARASRRGLGARRLRAQPQPRRDPAGERDERPARRAAAARRAGPRPPRPRRARRSAASGGSSSRPRSAFVRQRRPAGRRAGPRRAGAGAGPPSAARAPRRPRAAAGARRPPGAPSRRARSAGSMQRPVTVSRTCGNDGQAVAQQLLAERHLDAGRRGRGRLAEVVDLGGGEERLARRPAGEAQRPARGRRRRARRGARRPRASRAARASATASSARRPASSSQRTRARSGSDGSDERERRGEARDEPAPQAAPASAGRSAAGTRGARRPPRPRGARRRAGPRPAPRRRARSRRASVDRLALEHAAEVEPLHEREHEAVLEGGVQRELQQQVLGRGQAAQLAAAGAAARPQALGVEREEAGGGDDAAVQLHDPAARPGRGRPTRGRRAPPRRSPPRAAPATPSGQRSSASTSTSDIGRSDSTS